MALDVHCIKRPVITEGGLFQELRSSQKALATEILKRSLVNNISKRIFILFLQTNNNDNSKLTYVAWSYIAQQMLNNKRSTMLNSVIGSNFSSNKNHFEVFDNL